MPVWMAAFVLLPSLYMAPQGPANLAPNPGFEADADANGEPDGWWKWGGPGPKPATNLRRVKDNPHSGGYCAEVRDSASNANFYIASHYIEVQPGHAYVLYVWARGAGGQVVAIRIDELSAERKYLRTNRRAIVLDEQWQRYHVVAPRLSEDTHFVQLSLQPTTGVFTEQGVAWFDDVRFELADDRVRERIIRSGGDGWFPFPLDWRDGGPSPIDVTAYLPVEKTGAHGFLTIRDGHFVFEDGTPARFWATNIHASDAAFPSREEAPSFARRLARLGVNMVRVHLLEYSSPHGLIDPSGGTTDKLDPNQLDRFDYLMQQFHENGIYVIIDALPMCARRFGPGDGVKDYEALGLGAKGASYFDRRIIELEQSYARQLLLHRNPYRGLRYVDDPTVALIQMSNEDALLLWWSWRGLPESYRQDLQRMWNEWLVRRVGGRQALLRRWTTAEGLVGLEDDEDPAAGTVRLEPAAPGHPIRRFDVQRFLAEIQRQYWEEQVKFLRGLGVKVPICGTNVVRSPAMLASWTPLDYTDTHAYWDHPRFEKGREKFIHNLPMVRADPLSDAVLPTYLAMAKLAGKPAVATEWNSVWPNQWRAAATLMTPAYALLNDIDIVYIYCYLGGWGIGCDDARPKIHHGTVIFSDPAETGLFPVLALMYRRRDVKAGRNVVEMGISSTDAYLAPHIFTRSGDFQHFVPLISRWQMRIFDQRYQPGPDVALTVNSGMSATGDYSAARRLLLWGAEDRGREGRGPALWEWIGRLAGPLRPAAPESDEMVPVSGELPAGCRLWMTVPVRACLSAKGLARGSRTWLTGAAKAGPVSIGVEMMRNGARLSIAPGAGLTLAAASDLLARWFTDAGRRWGLLRGDAGYNPETGEIVSDTGQLRWRPRDGVWKCIAERACIIAGFMPQARWSVAGPLSVRPAADFGTYSLVSLDGAPIRSSKHLLLAAVGRAENTGQTMKQMVFHEPGSEPEPIGRTEVVDVGREPVLVQGLKAKVRIESVRGKWSCWALDPAGKRRNLVPVRVRDNAVELDIGPRWKTIYYELRAQ